LFCVLSVPLDAWTLNRIRALGQSRYRRLIQRFDWVGPQLTDQRAVFREAEQRPHP
jgi:hypothetical protein